MTQTILAQKSITPTVLLLFILIFGCGGHPRQAAPAPTGTHPPVGQGPAQAALDQPRTEWLVILVNGQKSGYVKSTRTPNGDKVTTEVVSLMTMKRGDAVAEIRSVSTMLETAEGTPIKIVKETTGAGMAQKVTGVLLSSGRLRLTTEAAGQMNSREIDWPTGALMSEGQRLEALRHGLEEGVTYTSTYFDPDLLEAVPVTVAVGQNTSLELRGRAAEGIHVKLTMTVRGNALDMDMYVDEEMNTLKTVTHRMGMSVEMVACSEQEATGKMSPTEIIRATFVAAPKTLTAKQRDNPITYAIRRISKAPLSIISTGEQTSSPKGEMLALHIEPARLESGGKLPYEGDDPAVLAALEASHWIQSDAGEIIALANIAKRNATHPAQAAANVSSFVMAYIRDKNFEVGYASALEVLKSRQGDCTEHALLTAALCRALGIPAQVVFGLVYVDRFEDQTDIFGGHAWTRVYVDDAWVSIDAAVGKFDTGHIALAVSNDGNPADFFQIADILGDIEIVSID